MPEKKIMAPPRRESSDPFYSSSLLYSKKMLEKAFSHTAELYPQTTCFYRAWKDRTRYLFQRVFEAYFR